MTEYEAAVTVWRERVKRAQKIKKERDRHQFMAYVLSEALRSALRGVRRSSELVEKAKGEEQKE